ncbi:Fms-interacting protein-domain-containing protein [Phyllosticta citricarpa]
MESSDIITSPDLQSVLDAANAARTTAESILTLLSSHAAADTRQASSGDHLPLDVDAAAQQQQQQQTLSTAQKELHAHLAHVRHLNRKALLSTRSEKQATAAARSTIDTLHLQLQNLVYEQRHLRSEIAACEAYPHPYLALPLIPEDDFLAMDAHAEVAARARELEDSGDMVAREEVVMEARIGHELAVRMELEEKRQGLLRRKQELVAENNKRREDLARLDGSLERFIEVSCGRMSRVWMVANPGATQAAKPIEQTFQKEY